LQPLVILARIDAGSICSCDCPSLSPNPVSETLHVDAPAFTGVGRLQLVNARGEEVAALALASAERVAVDVRSLLSRVYFVRIVAPGVRAVVRVVVMR
jgi:hypothetical protein